MSIELTFRQKCTRIIASSAICGLSISFITGEAVDQKAKLLRVWTTDAALVPSAYLPLRPIQAAFDQIKPDTIIGQLAAANSRVPSVVLDEKSIRREFVDVLKVTQAAPEARVPAVRYEAKPERPADKGVNTQDVESILLSIHNATNELAGREKALAPRVKTQPESPKKPEDTIVQSPPPAKGNWVLRGKFTNTQTLKEPGHFEVGFFSKIDAEGAPVGFPLVQKILPAGRTDFQLEISNALASGFLFGEFISAKGGRRFWVAPSVNPWLKSDAQFAELALQQEDVIASRAAAPMTTASEDRWTVRGTVDTMFAKTKILQDDVVVKVRGRKESVRTDKSGAFMLTLPNVKGNVHLEFLKPGYHPAIISVETGTDKNISVQLASRDAIDRLAHMMGSRQISTKGVFIGRAVDAEGAGLKGFSAALSIHADGPYYFNEDGFPSTARKSTSADGRFLFLNIDAGAGYVESSLNGEAIVPFAFNSVEGGEMSVRTLAPVSGTLKGRLFNPVAQAGKLQAVTGARVRLEGSSEWSTTDSFGAFSLGNIKWIRGQRAVIEFSAEKFNNHRYAVDLEKLNGPLNLFAFPANYIRRLAASMDVDLDPYAGIVFGKATGPAIRIDALADHSTINGAKDFYFDSLGRLRPSHTMTDPRFGTYLIFNVPKGHSLLQGSDANGKLRMSDSVVVNASTVTVVME